MRHAPAAAAVVLLAAGPAWAEPIRLSNGDVIDGEIVARDGQTVTIEHPVLGRLTVPAAGVEAVGEGAAQASEAVEAGEPEKVSDARAAFAGQKPGLFGGPVLRGYDKQFDLGLTGTSGNSDTLSFFARFDAKSDAPRTRTQFRLSYFLGSDDGDRTRNEADALVTRDWKVPDSPLFYFGRVTYEYDEFEPFEHRAGIFGGPGYAFVDREGLEVLGRIGGGAVYEAGEIDELRAEALAGVEVEWQVADDQALSFRNTIYPSLADGGEFRNVTELSYTIDVALDDGLGVKFAVENEYESQAPDDADQNDLKFLASIVYDF